MSSLPAVVRGCSLVSLVLACTSAPVTATLDTRETVTVALSFHLVLPSDAGVGLRAAAEDLVAVVVAQGGCASLEASGCEGGSTVSVVRDAQAPSLDAFRFTGDTLSARGDVGAANGLYHLTERLGAVWIHPEEPVRFTHKATGLPVGDGSWDEPRFALRGFHEHTQHPIPMSDYLLRPGSDDFRERVSRYLRWLARNRQNVLLFHALRTLDLPVWGPYMADIAAEARGYGIHMGAVVGFADEQQHAFKLIATASPDPDADIRAGLDALLAADLDYVGLQLGTSEFTKPADADVLHWLEVATEHLADKHPQVRAFAWIHITCSVKDEAGGYFFHLPLSGPESLGAFVHTTMFYTLTDPAPVYDCEDFGHQLEFVDAAEGKRELVFFPETAWWLGFDNNVPLVLPITGLSRERDIETLRGRDVTGHVTFTTGREWTYWQYDHYLTRATWSEESWDAYVAAISPLYGDHQVAARALIRGVTAAQEHVLYRVRPELFFYLSGELPQDEAGAAAGILARRPKVPFKEVLGYDEAAFALWRERDYAALGDFAVALDAALEPLESLGPLDASAGLVFELQASYETLRDRVAHVRHLYTGVIRVREGDRAGAEAELAAARAISERVIARVAEVEALYRDPLEILAEEKPDTLTAYPLGYLHETRTGYFWTRRDEQLALLIMATFDAPVEAWETPPGTLYAVEAEGLTLTQPSDPFAGSVIAGFIPRLLLGLSIDGGAATLVFGEDVNTNNLPDPDTETAVQDADITDGRFEATVTRLPLVVYDTAGAAVGTIGVREAVFDFTLDGGALSLGALSGGLETQPLVAAVLAIAGIDRAGIESLVKSVFGLPEDAPLPETVPVAFQLSPVVVP